MTKRKELPTIMPSIHTFAITGKIRNKYRTMAIDKAMHHAVLSGQYKWIRSHTIVKRGGGIQITLKFNTKAFGYDSVLIDNINLPRLTGDPSYLSLTDLSHEALRTQEEILKQELFSLGIVWDSDDISFFLRRLDLTQDFYVKSDPSLIIRNLRFAGESGLFYGIHPDHFKKHNEKHSARWRYHLYNVNIYDKHAEIKHRQELYHNVPESDLMLSKNRLRYEVSLSREFLRIFEHRVHPAFFIGDFGIKIGITPYFLEMARYIPTILRNVSSELFGEYAWQKVAYIQEQLDFARRVGIIDEKSCWMTEEYLCCLSSTEPFPLTPAKESTIRAVLDQLEVNRIVIPDRILTKRESCRFPCYPPGHFVQGEGESIAFLNLPERSWERRQKIHPIHPKKTNR